MAWRVVGVLIALFIGVAILGILLKALRWLLGVAIIIAIVAALVGVSSSRSKGPDT